MTKMTIGKMGTVSLTSALTLLLVACSNISSRIRPADDSMTLQVVSEINTLRAGETSWDAGDEIGIYVVGSDQLLTHANIYEGANNLAYVTSMGDGRFSPVSGRELPLARGKKVDVISFYPHQSVGNEYKLKVDVRDQSKPSKLDLLYSNNARGVDAKSPKTNLVFNHMMSQLQLTVLGTDGLDFSTFSVKVDGVVGEGTFDLATGSFSSLGTATTEVLAHRESNSMYRVMLLPRQELSKLKLTFEIGGKSYTYGELPTRTMVGGVRERFTFQLSSTGVTLVDSTIEVIDKGDEGTIDGVEIPSEIPVDKQIINLSATDSAPYAIAVSAESNEKWVASTSATFVHITAGSGMGAGVLNFYVDKNTSDTSRSAEIVVEGTSESSTGVSVTRKTTIILNQAGADDTAPTGYSNKASYMEQVLIKNGYMTDVIFVQHDAPNSWFINGSSTGMRRNYSIYFSKDKIQPYMVSYPLYKDCLGGEKRGKDWVLDPKISNQYQPFLKYSYVGGYSRGHMLASHKRTASRDLNNTTFFFTNVVPQLQEQNAGGWLGLENAEMSYLKSKTDTLYVVCGPLFKSDMGTVGDGNNKRIPIPTHTWKVMLRKNANGHYESLGVRMPNTSEAKSGSFASWSKYAVSVAELEDELGVTFFPQLLDSEATEVKNQKDVSKWR